MAHKLLRAHRPAETPAGHGVGLGEAVHDNGALLHAVDLREADMAVGTVGQAVVDLVGEHHDVGLADDVRDRLKLVAVHDRAGRVVRIGKDEQLGARRDGGAQRLGRQLELVLDARRQRHGNAACHLRERRVADKARLGDEHLLAGIDEGADGVVDRLGAADGDEDLLVCVVAQLVLAARERGDLAAQLGKTPVGGIEGLTLLKRLDAGAPDLPRGLEIRFADAERDCVGHFGCHFEKTADARRFDYFDAVRKHLIVVYHDIMTSLLSFSEGLYSTP